MPDEVELPGQVQLRGFHRHQAAASEGVAQGQAGNAANAQARLDRTFDRFGVFQLQADVQRAAMMTHGLIEGQASPGTLLAKNPRLMAKLLHAGSAALCQRMLGGTEHHQFVLDPALHFDVRMAAVAFD
ncbi:hypothetical protein D3C81_1897980 [compost metagenome]